MTKPDHIRVILETGHGDDWTRLYVWEGDTDLGPTLGLWKRIVRLLSGVQQPHDHGACTICELQMRRIAELEAQNERLADQSRRTHEMLTCYGIRAEHIMAARESDGTCAGFKLLLTDRVAELATERDTLRQRIAELEAREHAVNEAQTSDALDTIRTLCEERTQLQADLRTAAERHLDTLRKLYEARKALATGSGK